MSKLKPKHIHRDTGVILIEPDVSKVKDKRSVKIQPSRSLWLEKYPPGSYLTIPTRRFRDMWANVLRHTYISMTVGSFRSVGDAAPQR